MIVGPVFAREATTLPRRMRFYAARTLYVVALFGLMVTALILITGSQNVQSLGDWARFGAKVFQILATLQLALVTLLAAMATAAAVSYEKDRRTLVMLLLTNLNNTELVLGRLFASLLDIFVLVAVSLPLFLFIGMLGGVSYGQILHVEVVTVASLLLAGSLGSLIALWREKTFQALAMTAMLLVVWFLFWEFVAVGGLGEAWWSVSTSRWADAFSPWQAIRSAIIPDATLGGTQLSFATLFQSSVFQAGAGRDFVLFSIAAVVCINLFAIVRVRAWNATEGAAPRAKGNVTDKAIEGQSQLPETAPALTDHARSSRHVWTNPVLWREIRTWAYGKKVLFIRFMFIAMMLAAVFAAVTALADQQMNHLAASIIPPAARPIIPLLAVSILLINALAVTSITTERDGQALDILLVTDISAREFVFGKLWGVLYNAKEMILLPLVMSIYFWWTGSLSSFNLFYLIGGYLVMVAFASMLGIHSGLTYSNSRTAIGTSLGTLMFLFLGVAICMKMMVAFKGSYLSQLGAFSAFLGGGGIGLYFALGWRNPSVAIFMASMFAPIATFFVITSFLLGQYGAMFIVSAVVYGGATMAMLIPAVAEFDVVLGRTTGGEGGS